MSTNAAVLAAVRSLGINEAVATTMVNNGLTSDLVKRTELASRNPQLVPILQRQCNADASKIEAKQAKLKAEADKIGKQKAPTAPPAGPNQPPAPPVGPSTAVYWYCLGNQPQANQLTMAELIKIGASHYYANGDWQAVKSEAKRAGSKPMVNGHAVPFPRNVNCDNDGTLWVNLSGVSKFGGCRLDGFKAMLTDEAIRAAVLAELERLTQ
jgi:hypothetical protein